MSCEQIKASTKQISRIPKVSEKHRGDAADMEKDRPGDSPLYYEGPFEILTSNAATVWHCL